jgi:3',5'-cyclic AMP phosphodiesterase CpdA
MPAVLLKDTILCRTIAWAILLILFVASKGCSVFEYHPYETNIPRAYRDLNSKAINSIVANTPEKDTLIIIAMGDTQRFYDEVEDFVSSANKHPADFVLLNGDITDFGVKDEYLWVHDIMRKLNKPYVAVIGNHDLSGNGEKIYTKMYGPLNSTFLVNGYKIILLNTNSREYEFNGRVPDLAWLENELSGDEFEQALVVSHVPPFDDDFDSFLEPRYAEILEESGKVPLSLHGHRHSFHESEPYADGIKYLVSTSMDERMYLIIKLYDDQVTFEKIFY